MLQAEKNERVATIAYLDSIGYDYKELNSESIKREYIAADLNDNQTQLVLDFIQSVKALETGAASFNRNFDFHTDKRLDDLESKIHATLAKPHYMLLAQAVYKANFGFLVDKLYERFDYYVMELTPGHRSKDLEYFIMERAEVHKVIKDTAAYNELDDTEKQYWVYVKEFERYVYDYYSTF